MHSNKPALSFRVRTLNFFRRIFTLTFFENVLVGLIRKNPRNGLLRKIQPNNYLYPVPSIRKVNRWGINFELDISDYQEWLVYYVSDADSSFGVLDYLKEGDQVMDIGGNIGQTGLRIAQRIGSKGHVTSFEPYPPTFRKYMKNLSLNAPYQSVVAVENMGLGTEKSTVKMFRECVTNSGGNRVLHNEVANPAGLVDVQINTLDNYVADHSINKLDFIKIDVEGFELKVLKGARTTLLKFRPKLYIELSDSNLRQQDGSAPELLSFLEETGYTITRVDTGSLLSAASYSGNEHFDIYCQPAN